MIWIITMSSVEYGIEQFEYETAREAYEGLGRLAMKCVALDDGIERTFEVKINEEHEDDALSQIGEERLTSFNRDDALSSKELMQRMREGQ